jgi:hypothetical protein
MATLRRQLPLLILICTFGLTGSAVFAQEKGKAKAKGKQKLEARENHGRDAGEMPYGLVRHTERKGDLPAGLQKKKDEDGQLTRGLEGGAKSFKSAKAKKLSNR